MKKANNNPQIFYDNLAEYYHLVANNWQQAVERQRQQIGAFFGKISIRKNASILDCACGVGTQAIGLAQMEYVVHACDLSPQSIVQAKKNAQHFAVNIPFFVCDMRHLQSQANTLYDAIVALSPQRIE